MTTSPACRAALAAALAALGCDGTSGPYPHVGLGKSVAVAPGPAARPPGRSSPGAANLAGDSTLPTSASGTAPLPTVSAPSTPPNATGNLAGAPQGMLTVPAGEFTMGADAVGEEDERPAHRVTVAAFHLDVTEVTNADYRECVQAGACKAASERPTTKAKAEWFRGPRQPVVGVTWFDARDYCAFVKKRLPTEAEWEKAARGTDGRTYPWGEASPDRDRHANFGRGLGSPDGVTRAVGSFPEGAGPYGHLDLSGNVWEWVQDEYDPYAYRRDMAPRGVPGTCEEILAAQDELRRDRRQGFTGSNPIPTVCERVLRGGAFNYEGRGLRASNRVHHPGTWRLVMAGFRCARDATPVR